MRFFKFILLLQIISFSSVSLAQFTSTSCQSTGDALIGTDRNNWAHNNLAVVNEGYLHNFETPELPCGLENAQLTSVVATIEILSINNDANCNGVPLFGNVLIDCALATNSVCPIEQDVLSPGCNFGQGQFNPGIYSLNLSGCGVNPTVNSVIGVDIIPATENLGGCPSNGLAITQGLISVDYTICLVFTYNMNGPVACANSVEMPCNDNDDCTTNDVMLVDECDNTIICIPCAGLPIADCNDTEVITCDDGNPCTFNDQETVSSCDNTFICIPCAGVFQADCDNTVSLPCDDGDVCTINDLQVVSACDNNTECVPCAGTPAQICDNTVALLCDDADFCTANDVVWVDACDNTIICIPCAGELTPTCDDVVVLPCTDNDPCTINDEVTVSVCDNSFVCIPCAGVLAVDCTNTIELPCDDGILCTGNDVVTVSACDNDLVCIPCAGTPVLACELTVSVPCDDGDSCTENDVEIRDACFGAQVCIPCTGTPVFPIECDDLDCSNGIEFWDESTCACATEPTILGCTDVNSCNYNAAANCDFECDYSCVDCNGVIFGDWTTDDCGICLAPDNELRDLNCLPGPFIPNSFTPDNDGVNDFFSVVTPRPFSYFQITVVNKWGLEVYSSNDPNFKWLGNKGDYYLTPDLYTYKLVYSFHGSSMVSITSHVALIR